MSDPINFQELLKLAKKTRLTEEEYEKYQERLKQYEREWEELSNRYTLYG